MARLPYVDPATASPAVREGLEAVPPLNIFRMVAHAETAFRPFLRFGGALLTQAQLDDRLRELAILRVAALSGAEYEWVQHDAIARAVGCADEQIAAIERGEVEAACFDGTERAVLAFTTEVVEGVGASEPTFELVRRALSPREIVELVLTIGNYMMLARLMETTQIDLDPPAGIDVLNSVRRS